MRKKWACKKVSRSGNKFSSVISLGNTSPANYCVVVWQYNDKVRKTKWTVATRKKLNFSNARLDKLFNLCINLFKDFWHLLTNNEYIICEGISFEITDILKSLNNIDNKTK